MLFLTLAVVAVAAAVGMLLSANAVHSALFLILNFATVSLFYLLLNAPFIAMVQVTVYAGAIMVLFLFVIMLLGAERLRQKSGLRWQGPLAIILTTALLVEAGYILFLRGAGPPPPAFTPDASAAFGSPTQIGGVLFNQYLFPFELTSFLLLVAMIGAVVLTQEERKTSKSKAQTPK